MQPPPIETQAAAAALVRPKPEEPPGERQSAIVVTGSSGLIGSRLCERFAHRHAVFGLDRRRAARVPRGMTFLECDLTRDDSVEDAVARIRAGKTVRIASVVHLAAHYDFTGEPSPLYDELTVEGTRRLLRALRGLPVEQFVFSSTMLVMKAAEPGEVIEESSPVESTWEYPRSKLDSEEVIRREHGSIPAVVLRIAGVYDEDTHSIPLAQQMRRIREKKLESYFFPGNPDRGQPFVHLDDLMDAFERVIDARHRLDPYEVFLIAEPDIVTYSELQDTLGEAIHGREWPTIRIPAPVAKVGAWIKDKLPSREESFVKPWMIDLADAHYPVSIERARRLLAWTPRQRLRSMLERMAARLREDPERWYEENGLEPPEDEERDRSAQVSGA